MLQRGFGATRVKLLAEGTFAASLFNTLDHPLDAMLDIEALGRQGVTAARDVWWRRDLGRIDATHSSDVPTWRRQVCSNALSLEVENASNTWASPIPCRRGSLG